MKRFPKLIVTLLLLAMVIGIFTAMPVAAADYDTLRLKSSHLTVGHYTTQAMDGEIVQHSANKNYKEEITCLVDNSNSNGYWSKPYKFKDLKDEGGSIIPVILIDVAAFGNGNPVAIAGFDLRLRNSFDCRPLHVVLQVTTNADSDNWTTVKDKTFAVSDWDTNPKQRIEFDETTAYKFRALFYNIGDADVAADAYKDYEVVKGDETRLALTEIDLLTIKEGGDSNSGSTTTPTTGGSQTPTTRPVIQFPTKAPGQTTTQPATKAPTQPATKAPTQPATQAPTKAPDQPATQAPTKAPGQTTTVAPTQPATQDSTVAPTTATVAPTEPTGTVDPSAPTEPTGTVDPSAPTEETVDPSAPTDEPTVAPTDEPTQAPTVEATEPQATTGTTDNGTEEAPKDFPWIIVVIIAAAVVAGGAVFFIIKKKKQG